MTITKLTIQNLMKISLAEITPEGNMVVIAGKNGQGKTSILNSFAFALGGKRLIPERPIKDGETSAQVTVELDDYTVTRRWTANDKSTVKIESKDGAIYKSPQNMLDKVVIEDGRIKK
jgi:DNA repair exonuclease SbcCD ATPase subunit